MGKIWSQPEPPPSPTLATPWRKIQWGNKHTDLQYLQYYKPHSKKIEHLRILLHGPAGAGKSSFINSINTVFQERITGPALANATEAGESFTKNYEVYKIEKGDPGTFYSFVFNDIKGLEMQTNRGVHPDDVKLALKGHVKDGYKFNPDSNLSEKDPDYNKNPTLKDQVHVLVCVIPADTLSLLSKEVIQKIIDIRKAASDMEIPQLAILTKIDQACPEIQRDIKNVYRSKHLKEKMEQFHALVGIPLYWIFPVKNYHSEDEINDDIDSLILRALRRMIESGEDFINRKYSD